MSEPLLAPHEALPRLIDRTAPVGVQTVELASAGGRVLAEPLLADRPSPPADVSAMDGYAMRREQAVPGRRWPVLAECRMGQPPPPDALFRVNDANEPKRPEPWRGVARVSTGSPPPAAAEIVLPRELVTEDGRLIEVAAGVDAAALKTNIRRAGENAPAGARLLGPGQTLGPAAIAAAAAVGAARLQVFRRVRVGVMVSGDEFGAAAGAIDPWRIRDSNGPAIAAWLGRQPVAELVGVTHVRDDLDQTVQRLQRLIRDADLIITSGGVSMGHRDFLPEAARRAGAEPVYHKLAMRPGKPNFAAATADGAVVMGLPGNPVSVLCGLARLVAPTLHHLAGSPPPAAAWVSIAEPDHRPLHLWHYRAARLTRAGRAELLDTRGSGDVANTATAEGFLETPPRESIGEARPFYRL